MAKFVMSDGSFIEIYTADDPDPNGRAPQKKPYLAFKASRSDDAGTDLFRKFRELLSAQGLDTSNENYRSLTITSARKVQLALEMLGGTNEFPGLQEFKDNIDRNPELKKLCDELYDKCEELLDEKAEKEIPLKSKHINAFKTVKTNPKKSYNQTEIIERLKSKTPGKQYVLKKNVHGRTISEIEAFNGFCYSVLLGNKHPEMKVIIGDDGKRIGVTSKMIPRLKTAEDYAKETKHKISPEMILKGKLIHLWVTAYGNEETDMHAGNFSYDGQKWDDDRSNWMLTSKYIGVDPETGWIGSTVYGQAPKNDFKVTARDIASFPFLTDARPHHWLHNISRTIIDSNDIAHLSKTSQQFNDDKHFMFLKMILVPDQLYEGIGLATISSEKTRKKFIDHKCAKTKELMNVLMEDPEFVKYISSHPDVIKQIKQEFEAYNDSYAKDTYLHVDTKKVEEKFNLIYMTAQVKESAQKDKQKQEASDKLYQQGAEIIYALETADRNVEGLEEATDQAIKFHKIITALKRANPDDPHIASLENYYEEAVNALIGETPQDYKSEHKHRASRNANDSFTKLCDTVFHGNYSTRQDFMTAITPFDAEIAKFGLIDQQLVYTKEKSDIVMASEELHALASYYFDIQEEILKAESYYVDEEPTLEELDKYIKNVDNFILKFYSIPINQLDNTEYKSQIDQYITNNVNLARAQLRRLQQEAKKKDLANQANQNAKNTKSEQFWKDGNKLIDQMLKTERNPDGIAKAADFANKFFDVLSDFKDHDPDNSKFEDLQQLYKTVITTILSELSKSDLKASHDHAASMSKNYFDKFFELIITETYSSHEDYRARADAMFMEILKCAIVQANLDYTKIDQTQPILQAIPELDTLATDKHLIEDTLLDLKNEIDNGELTLEELTEKKKEMEDLILEFNEKSYPVLEKMGFNDQIDNYVNNIADKARKQLHELEASFLKQNNYTHQNTQDFHNLIDLMQKTERTPQGLRKVAELAYDFHELVEQSRKQNPDNPELKSLEQLYKKTTSTIFSEAPKKNIDQYQMLATHQVNNHLRDFFELVIQHGYSDRKNYQAQAEYLFRDSGLCVLIQANLDSRQLHPKPTILQAMDELHDIALHKLGIDDALIYLENAIANNQLTSQRLEEVIKDIHQLILEFHDLPITTFEKIKDEDEVDAIFDYLDNKSEDALQQLRALETNLHNQKNFTPHSKQTFFSQSTPHNTNQPEPGDKTPTPKRPKSI